MDALLAILPYAVLLLLCPLMMIFMHRGHDAHGEHGDDHTELAGRLRSSKDDARS